MKNTKTTVFEAKSCRLYVGLQSSIIPMYKGFEGIFMQACRLVAIFFQKKNIWNSRIFIHTFVAVFQNKNITFVSHFRDFHYLCNKNKMINQCFSQKIYENWMKGVFRRVNKKQNDDTYGLYFEWIFFQNAWFSRELNMFSREFVIFG